MSIKERVAKYTGFLNEDQIRELAVQVGLDEIDKDPSIIFKYIFRNNEKTKKKRRKKAIPTIKKAAPVAADITNEFDE